jgi:thymidylate synthase (FAD)
VCDRGCSHELVRHRLCSFSQESTRYCDYESGKFDGEITVIQPPGLTPDQEAEWRGRMVQAELGYQTLRHQGCAPQIARSVLPNSLKTEIVMSCNAREFRHFFTLRTAKAAHPQMREIACPMLAEFRRRVPVLFDDVGTADL